MEKQIILEDLISIMRQLTNNPTLVFNEDATANDIDGWSSLVHTELIAEIEKHFGFKFSLMEVLSMKKEIPCIINLIKQHV